MGKKPYSVVVYAKDHPLEFLDRGNYLGLTQEPLTLQDETEPRAVVEYTFRLGTIGNINTNPLEMAGGGCLLVVSSDQLGVDVFVRLQKHSPKLLVWYDHYTGEYIVLEITLRATTTQVFS